MARAKSKIRVMPDMSNTLFEPSEPDPRYINGIDVSGYHEISMQLIEILDKNKSLSPIMKQKRATDGYKILYRLSECFLDFDADQLVEMTQWAVRTNFCTDYYLSLNWLVKERDGVTNYEYLKKIYQKKTTCQDAKKIIKTFCEKNTKKNRELMLQNLLLIDRMLLGLTTPQIRLEWRNTEKYWEVLKFFQCVKYSIRVNYAGVTWIDVLKGYFIYLRDQLDRGLLKNITIGFFSIGSKAFNEFVNDWNEGYSYEIIDIEFMVQYMNEKEWQYA